MPRYIDADALIRVFNAKADMAIGTPKEVFLSVAKMVDYLPPVDVVQRAEVAREIDDLRRHILLNENISIKCKRENGEQNEEYWKGKVSALRQIRAYIDSDLKNKYTEKQK